MTHPRMPQTGDDPRETGRGGTTSTHLRRLSEEAVRRGSLSIAEMIETMGTSSIAFTVLVLALPALTPIPGPFGMLFGTCLAFVSLQIIAGARHLKLPGFIGRRRISAENVALIVRHTAPVIARVERLLRPGRLPGLTGPAVQRLLGIPILFLAVAIALPIPLGNVLPVIALVIIAMALLERDGLATLIGVVAAIGALAVTGGLLYAAFSASAWLLR